MPRKNREGDGRAGIKVTEAIVTVRSRAECDHRFSKAGPRVIDTVRSKLPQNQKSLSTICADSTLDLQAGSCNDIKVREIAHFRGHFSQ